MRVVSILMVMFFPMVVIGQLTVGAKNAKVLSVVKNGPVLIASITYTTSGTDTTYNLEFNNADESAPVKDMRKVSFASNGNTLSGLYEVLKDFFSEKNKKNKAHMVDFTLGETKITASNVRMLGKTSIMVKSPDGFFYLTEKQLEKLFNK